MKQDVLCVNELIWVINYVSYFPCVYAVVGGCDDIKPRQAHLVNRGEKNRENFFPGSTCSGLLLHTRRGQSAWSSWLRSSGHSVQMGPDNAPHPHLAHIGQGQNRLGIIGFRYRPGTLNAYIFFSGTKQNSERLWNVKNLQQQKIRFARTLLQRPSNTRCNSPITCETADCTRMLVLTFSHKGAMWHVDLKYTRKRANTAQPWLTLFISTEAQLWWYYIICASRSVCDAPIPPCPNTLRGRPTIVYYEAGCPTYCSVFRSSPYMLRYTLLQTF